MLCKLTFMCLLLEAAFVAAYPDIARRVAEKRMYTLSHIVSVDFILNLP